ncbi:MAG: hypothetical protein HY064_07845 [Bacteroidetes bacterium]|nr:hypothetical protein [Bacteroidota bacterium]
MPNKKYFIFFSCLLPLFAAAQLFLPIDDDPFGVPVKFNADSIRIHRIFSITANLQYKPDGKIIDDRGLKQYYRFDSLGRLAEFWKTTVRNYASDEIVHPAVYRKGRRIRGEWTETINHYNYDSVFVYYYYDNVSRLSCRRECDGDFYHTWYYLYNEDGTIARQTHCRETNIGTGRDQFRLGMQTIISQEDFSYKRFSPQQVKQFCLNDEGKPYKEMMMNFDKKDRPVEFREEYTAGGIRTVSLWKYDSLDRTSEISYTSNAGGDFTETTKYNYDSLGRIESVKRFTNDQLKDEFSYLYHEHEPVAYAYINRRHLEAGIDIVKMDIRYW